MNAKDVLNLLEGYKDYPHHSAPNLNWVFTVVFKSDKDKFAAWYAKQGANPEANAFKYRQSLEKNKKVSEEREVNYTVSAVLTFDDGQNKGNLTVRATSESEAKSKATQQLHKTWGSLKLKKIEIVKIKRG